MIKLIVGKKGAGKTKILIDMANQTVKTTKGNVVFIEKGMELTYGISHQIRLVDTLSNQIDGFDMFFGFISGICAANYDVTDIFIDGLLKICGKDMDALGKFIDRLQKLSARTDTTIVVSVSADEEELPKLEAEIIRP